MTGVVHHCLYQGPHQPETQCRSIQEMPILIGYLMEDVIGLPGNEGGEPAKQQTDQQDTHISTSTILRITKPPMLTMMIITARNSHPSRVLNIGSVASGSK